MRLHSSRPSLQLWNRPSQKMPPSTSLHMLRPPLGPLLKPLYIMTQCEVYEKLIVYRIIFHLSSYSANPNYCSILCNMEDDCGSFYYENSACYLANLHGLVESPTDSPTTRTVWIEGDYLDEERSRHNCIWLLVFTIVAETTTGITLTTSSSASSTTSTSRSTSTTIRKQLNIQGNN